MDSGVPISADHGSLRSTAAAPHRRAVRSSGVARAPSCADEEYQPEARSEDRDAVVVFSSRVQNSVGLQEVNR